MDYREFAPPPRLAPFIRCFWTLRGGDAADRGSPRVERLIPDGSPELVLHLGDPFEQVDESGGARRTIAQPSALVAGQLRSPLLLSPTGRIDIIAVRFRPAGLVPFLRGIEGRELVDRRVAIGDLDPALDRALDPVRSATTPRERLHSLARALSERVSTPASAARDPIAAAAAAIERSGGAATLAEICREVGLHERSLQRGFGRSIGLSPKRLARIVRFQRFFRALAAAPPGGTAGLALDCGYYDQPHLLREARELAGSPVGLLDEDTTLSRLFSRTGEGDRADLSGTSKRSGGPEREDARIGRRGTRS